MNSTEIRKAIKEAPLGKKVGGDLYMVRSCLHDCGPELNTMSKEAWAVARKEFEPDELFVFHLIKFSPKNKVSFLRYPEFFKEAHPSLESYIIVDLNKLTAKRRFYRDPQRSFVLHRKETMIPKYWFCFPEWEALTQQEEEAGLLNNPPGQRTQWEALLAEKGYRVEGHSLVSVQD